MGSQVTVSAKIDETLRKKMTELGIKPSTVIKRALMKEVREKEKEKLSMEASRASVILRKVSEAEWTEAVRKGRDEG